MRRIAHVVEAGGAGVTAGMRTPILALSLAAAACVSTDYTGIEYPPTDSVLVYYQLEDVERPYVVIGNLDAAAATWTEFETVERELAEDAMALGAHGLVIEGADLAGAGGPDPGERIGPFQYVRGPGGELRREAHGPVPVPHFQGESRGRQLDATLLRFTD